jgi:hypothetical protein
MTLSINKAMVGLQKELSDEYKKPVDQRNKALIVDDEALLETMRNKYSDNCADFVPSDRSDRYDSR